jgi:hypothetical protein
MSKFTQFYGYRTPYDEDQARERYLAILKSRQRTSALKQTAERDLSAGIETPAPAQKTTSEILSDEAELQRQVLATLSTLLQRPDGRKQGVNEPVDDYQQRINPALYVYKRLTPDIQRLLVTQVEGIKKDLGGAIGKMLPADFLVFLDAYNTSYQESGGVSSFNRTNVVLERLRGLQEDIAQASQIGEIKYLLEKIKKEARTDRAISADDKAEMANQIQFIGRKLDLIKRALQVDISRVGEQEIRGDEDVLNSYERGRMSLNSESRTERIAQEIERNIPTNQTLADITQMLAEFDEIGGSRGLGVEGTLGILERVGSLVAPVTEQGVSNIERISVGRPLLDVGAEEEFPYTSFEDRLEGRREYVPPSLPESLVGSRVSEIESRITQIPVDVLNDRQFKAIKKRVGNEYRQRGVYTTNPTAEIREQINAEALREFNAFREQVASQPSIMEAFRRTPARPTLIAEEETQVRENPEDLEVVDEFGNPITQGFGVNYGMFGKSKARIARTRQAPRFMVGRGLSLPKTQTKYVEFGKYALSIPQLHKGILTTKYANNGNSVISFPPMKITPDFADFMEEFIETQHLDEKRLTKLPADEKRLFAKLINGSGLYGKYKVKVAKSKEEDDEEKRFHLVKGMFVAGNDNPQVLKELKQLIIKFMADGRIPRTQGQDLLLQLTL